MTTRIMNSPLRQISRKEKDEKEKLVEGRKDKKKRNKKMKYKRAQKRELKMK